MDEQLAAIYGTGQPEAAYDEGDLQKTAAAELLVKLAEEEGTSLDNFTDEEIQGMVNELYGESAAQPEPQPAVDPEQARVEKVAEADHLGRIMAHAMVQELNNIEKAAGIADKARDVAGKAWAGLKRGGAKAGEVAEKAGKAMSGGRLSGGKAKALAGGTAAAAGLGGAAAVRAAMKGKKKEAAASEMPALEQLAQQRAFEMAKQAGYIDEEGNLLLPQEEQPEQAKMASSDLQYAVDHRALQILESHGLPVQWNE